MMNFCNPMEWYQEQEKHRMERIKKQEISLINQQLQNLLHQVQNSIKDWKVYESVVHDLEYQYRLVQSGLWYLQYATNYENIRVALAQGLLITHILKQENDLKNKSDFKRQLERLMSQMGHVNWDTYLEYQSLKNHI